MRDPGVPDLSDMTMRDVKGIGLRPPANEKCAALMCAAPMRRLKSGEIQFLP
jgi:hypothetical protein